MKAMLKQTDQRQEQEPPQRPWVQSFLQHGRLTELDRATVAETIRKIRIFEDGHIEITYAFSNELGLLESEGGIVV